MVLANKVEEAVKYNLELRTTDLNIKSFLPYENAALAYLLSGDTLKSAPLFLDAIERGLNGENVLGLLESFYKKNGQEKEWEK